jgi:hypothetical protein
MLLLAAGLFFATPAPLEMPRADAFFVKTAAGAMRLEDRYDPFDLWLARALIGRWEDAEGRVFALARLSETCPRFAGARQTRSSYARAAVAFDPRDKTAETLLETAVDFLSPVEPDFASASPRADVRGIKDVRYYEGTNETAVVCAFLPEKAPYWYYASWTLAPGDDREACRGRFEDEILSRWPQIVSGRLPDEARRLRGPAAVPSDERALLRADTRASVANYPSWRVTDAETFSVLDDLGSSREFVAALTNDLSAMRARYAEVMPSPVDGSNVLAVARLFRDRGDYLLAAGSNMAWTAAYWSRQRRELVAYLPPEGEGALLKTVRHEAFHQYFSYACAMIPPSPWLNEGYAQYFEDETDDVWAREGDRPDPELAAALLPAVFAMDYAQFYDGDDEARRLKYRLAWSVAYFLEHGAPSVRFRPFETLKRDYLDALFETKDMRAATAAAFRTREAFELFVSEWKKFWWSR